MQQRELLRNIRTFLSIFLMLTLVFPATLLTGLANAANASADLDQCANGSLSSPDSTPCQSGTEWVNGNLGASKSHYYEGDSVPYRMRFDNLTLASHAVTIQWDTTQGGKHATDYLTTFNRTVTTADPCAGVTGCSSSSTFPIPADSQVTGAGVTPVAGNFTLFGGTITGVSAYSYPDGTGFAGNKTAQITITFTATQANPVLAWGGHISTRTDWGLDNAAVTISGSPYHMRLKDLDGAGGNQDRSLSADAVIFPASITIVKDAVPNSSTSFPFTASPSPLSNFNLVDDGTSSNTKVFSNITNFQTYTVTEGSAAGWSLDHAACTVASANGGSQNVSGTTATINLKEGENVTCTYTNAAIAPQLIVIKHVINDNGGTAVASDFTMNVTGDGATPNSFAGAESPGTTVTLNPGSYSVSENSVAGYSASYSADCVGTIAYGETKTCTVTNNDISPTITVTKVVINDNGGTKVVSDFPLFVGATQVTSGVTNNFNAGNYTVSETSDPGYAATFSGDCDSHGALTLALGENATCTITNNDIQPTLTVTKIVINDNGGTKQVSDFPLFVGATQVTSGETNGFNAGTYNVSETSDPGYAATFSGDCSALGNVTLNLGDSKHCTITNNDLPATITIIKTIINDNGGTVTSFPLFIGSLPMISGISALVDAGNYIATETNFFGYLASLWGGDCAPDGSVTLNNGDNKTCTITNNDIQPTLTVTKVVVNDDGGTKVVSDFPLFVGTTQVTSGATNGFDAGTYQVSETNSPGYTASFSGDCDEAGFVTLSVGDTKSCTITNNDNPATLTVIKHVINDSGTGTSVASDFTLHLTYPNAFVNSFAGNEAGNEFTGLSAGNYTVSETATKGYTTSFSGDCDASGNVALANGDSKTCTVTNNDNAPVIPQTTPTTVTVTTGECTSQGDPKVYGDKVTVAMDVPGSATVEVKDGNGNTVATFTDSGTKLLPGGSYTYTVTANEGFTLTEGTAATGEFTLGACVAPETIPVLPKTGADLAVNALLAFFATGTIDAIRRRKRKAQ